MVCSTKFLEVQKTDTQWCRSELFLRQFCIACTSLQRLRRAHPPSPILNTFYVHICLLGSSQCHKLEICREGGDSREDQCVFTFPHPGHSAETLSDQSKQNPTETLSSPTWSVLSPDISEEVLQHSYQNSKILQLVPFLLYSEPGRYFCCNVQCWCIEGMTKVSQSVKLLLTNK